MIEHHRDEEVCLTDEEHTHHLTEQEHFHCKNKWWFHSNKQGSNTMPLTQRPDFKQALSTLQRLQQEAGQEPQVPTYSHKHQQWEARSSSPTWWFTADSLSFATVKEEVNQVLSERCDLLLAVFDKILRKKTFMNSIYFVAD